MGHTRGDLPRNNVEAMSRRLNLRIINSCSLAAIVLLVQYCGAFRTVPRGATDLTETLHHHAATSNESCEVNRALPTIDQSQSTVPAVESLPDHACEDIPQAIGIALSGGGVRAALFSLGVLMYLVHSELNQRVAMISSVSGGSITNAAIAASGDISTMKPDEFEPVCSRLAHRLAKEGSFFLPPVGRITKLLLLLAAFLSFEFFALDWLQGQRDMALQIVTTALVLVELIVPFFLYIVLRILFRKVCQRNVYKRLINCVQSEKEPGLGRRSIALKDLATTNVAHVICATELLSGQPMFFSKDWVYSEAFGWGEPNIAADRAVYASAAFPGAFTPLRLPTARLKMGGGESIRDRPPALLLADGGVFNNLGTDWFRIARELRDTHLRQDHRFQPPPHIDYSIVVNASAPPKVTRLSRVPVLHMVLVFGRTMTVLYENTVRPRIKELDQEPGTRTIVIDISMSPIELAERARDGSGSDHEIRRRAKGLIKELEELHGLSGHYWDDLVDDTSLLKTTLRSVGTERAARLMRHGYLSAMVALHARFGTSGIRAVPDDRAFLDLTENRKMKLVAPPQPGSAGS
jgi:predicted acylesterase/phospholipase RssA